MVRRIARGRFAVPNNGSTIGREYARLSVTSLFRHSRRLHRRTHENHEGRRKEMIRNKVGKPVALAVGAALAGSFAVTGVASADTGLSPFAMTTLSAGYLLGAGEGNCGGDKAKGDKAEGSCGGDKGAEGNCGGDKDKGAEGNCGGDKDKDAEGKCGEGKCGGDKKEKDAEGKCGGAV
jgi:uncharacterized low-complexity protein